VDPNFNQWQAAGRNYVNNILRAYFFIDIIILEIYNVYNYIPNGNDREK